jgi:hypothetical protein
VPHLNCSVCQPPTTSFSSCPIGTLAALARMLKYPILELQHIASTANQRYRIGKQELKKDGTLRICYDALGPLKSIQARIQCMILNRVTYPTYLQGSIKDPISPRGQKANAALHTRKRTLITEDVKQFFPSVRSQIVFDIWHKFFTFPPTIAQLLTKLTTKNGLLPQGTKTSALLSNLVFWEDEWRLVGDLHMRGITYTRLIDDITCSSKLNLSTEQTTSIITALHAMAHRKGLKLNAVKQTIARAGERQVTTKLVVNVKTALPAEQRSAIRAAVRNLQNTPRTARTTERYEKDLRRIGGRVAYLKQHHPKEADQLRSILRTLPQKVAISL